MKKPTKELLYGALLGSSFLIALPFSIKCMLHSQDEDSALFRRAVAVFQKEEKSISEENDWQDFLTEETDSSKESDNMTSIDEEPPAAEPLDDSLHDEEVSEADTEDEPIVYTQVERDYFDDAFFVGDSRTLGIMEYGGLENSVFYANSGMSVFKLYESECKVPGMGKVTYEDALHAKSYKKVYIMLGMNEMGYEYDYILMKYRGIIDEIMEVHPDTIVYVCANLHLTKEAQGEILNNPDLDRLNERISELADGKRVFYLDINPYYDDGDGNLNPEYSTDGVHIYAKYYEEWVNWFSQNAVADIPEWHREK